MQYMLWLVLAPAAVVLSHLAAAPAASGMVQSPPESVAPRPGCSSSSMCGNVEIPFPFGISQDCALPMAMSLGNFTIICNYSFHPPKPFIGNIEVINISLVTGQMIVRSLVASICYKLNSTYSNVEVNTNLVAPYLISPTSNELTAIGCSTIAFLANNEATLRHFTGCISYCASMDDAAENGDDCAGLGCCKTVIASNLDTLRVFWGNSDTPINDNAWKYSPCSYAFVAKKGWYHFSRPDLTRQGNDSFERETIPLVLDWAIRNGSCVNVSGNQKGPACISNNSTCVNVTNGDGYLCNCTKGYEGNPYVLGGCTTTLTAVVLACFAIILLHTRNQRKLFSQNGGDILNLLGIKIFTQGELKTTS